MDLLVRAVDCGGAYVIAVEAKADECFGETIGDALANAVERKLMNPSNGIVRIEQLAAALLGPKKNGEAPLRTLRYQLFTAAAGVLAEARRKSVGRAVLLVHEFFTLKTLDAKHQENARDLNRFVHRLSHGQFPIVQAGILYGPIRVPDSPLFTQVPDLYIGKAVRHLRVPLCLPSVSHSP